MQLIAERTIYKGRAGTPTANCCFPAVARLSDGTYLVSWRVGSNKDSADGKLLLSRSTDSGRTWSPAEQIPLAPYAEKNREGHYGPLTPLHDGRVLAAIMGVDRSDPTLPFFHPTTEGLLPTRTLFCESRDAGRTWNHYREMDAAPYHCPMPLTGAVLQLADGTLACPFEVNKEYDDTRPWRHAAAWKISSDGGETWPECVEIANDPTGRLMYWDARYALGRDGFCLGTFWTFDRSLGHDANVHLSVSTDHGRHWSPLRDIGITAQVCHPVLLNDDRLVLLYIDRFQTRSIRAVLSNDMGESFRDETVVYQHPRSQPGERNSKVTADYLQDMEAWTFGRVDALADPDGHISIVFYAGSQEATNIHWARLRVSAADF